MGGNRELAAPNRGRRDAGDFMRPGVKKLVSHRQFETVLSLGRWRDNADLAIAAGIRLHLPCKILERPLHGLTRDRLQGFGPLDDGGRPFGITAYQLKMNQDKMLGGAIDLGRAKLARVEHFLRISELIMRAMKTQGFLQR